MPRLPDADDLGDRSAQINTRQPMYAARTVSGGDALREAAAGIQQYAAAENDFEIGNANQAVLQGGLDARKELEDDQDYQTHEKRFTERMAKTIEAAGAKISNGPARAAFDATARLNMERELVDVRAGARRQEAAQGRGTLLDTLQKSRVAALEAKDDATRIAYATEVQRSLRGAVERGYISPEDGVAQGVRWSQDFAEGRIGMLPAAEQVKALKDPTHAEGKMIDPAKRAALLARAEDDAKEERVSAKVREVLGVFETDVKAGSKAIAALKDSGLTPEEQLEARGQIQRGRGLIHAERRQEFNDQVTSLERAISSGVPGPKAEAQATFLYRRGAYSDEQYTNTLERIDNARQTGAKNAATMDVVTNALATGKPLDPRNDKVVEGIDTLFKSGTELAGIERGSDDWVSNATALAKKTNILPPDAMSWARANMLSGDPKLVGPAATALKTWATESPVAYSYFNDPNLKAYAATVSSIIDAGGSPERAVEVARQNLDIPPARQDALKATYTKDKHAAGNPDDLQTRMNGEDAFEVGFLGKSPPASQAMRDEYGAAVRTYFDKTGGDIAQARELAWADIRGVYGASTVNGYPEILKYAPERRFPGIDPEVIRNDAIETAKARGVTTPVRLVPTHATDTTQGVEWELHTVDEDGREEVVLRPDNRPVRYMIPTDTQVYLKKQEDAKRAAVEAARADSKSRRELADMVAEFGTYPRM